MKLPFLMSVKAEDGYRGRGLSKAAACSTLARFCATGLAASTLLFGAAPAPADPLPSLPEVPKQHVERAIAISRLNALEKMRNEFVIPNWIGSTGRFWYKKEVEGGHEWILVDAATGAKRPLFDRGRLAETLGRTVGAAVDLNKLPVRELKDLEGGGVVMLDVGGRAWKCVVEPVIQCSEGEPAQDPMLVPSPDGSRIAFLRGGNLWVRERSTGQERALTSDGEPLFAYAQAGYDRERAYVPRVRGGKEQPPAGISWSPDGKRLLVPKIDQRHIAPYPLVESSPVDGSHRPKVHLPRIALVGETPAKWQWHVVDVESGGVRRIDLPEGAVDGETLHRTEWSADGKRIHTIGFDRYFQARHLLEIDAWTGRTQTILSDRTMRGWGRSEDAPFRIFDGGRRFLWSTIRDDHVHLDLHDLATGKRLRRVTSGPWGVRAVLGIDENDRRLFFVANGREKGNPYHRYLYSIGLDGKSLRLLTPEVGDHQVLDPTASNGSELQDETPSYQALSPDFRHVAYAWSTVSQPTRFAIRRTSDGSLVSVYEETDASALFAAGYRPPEELTARSADGKHELWGLVYRPSYHDPRRKYPVFNVQYINPNAATTPRNFNGAITRQLHFATNAASAELGFIVTTVDGRGTLNRDYSFTGPKRDFLATMGLEDHVAFIRHVAKRDPSLDLDRVGIAGASFGGWTALRAMLEFPNFYKVAVAATVPGTFHAMPNFPGLTSTLGEAKYGDKTILSSPEAIPQNWQSINSLAQVGRLSGKLLLVVGEHDEHVLPPSTLQFFDRAVAAEKDVWMMYVPNAAHNVVGYEYVMRESLNFLLQHLAGTRLPSGTTIPSPVPFPLDPRKAKPMPTLTPARR